MADVEFERFRKADLRSVSVSVQALDNQWLPRNLLTKAQKKGKITSDIDKELRQFVRAEYIRSLINGEQVIINRAYLYNNPAISQDYSKKDSLEYKAFKALLEEKIIIPCLLLEESPVEKQVFEVQKEAFDRWVALCKDVRTHCIRLSWSTEENKKLVRNKLYSRFHQFVASAAARDFDTYIQDLRLSQQAKDSLRKTLVKMGKLCLDLNDNDELVTRNILYKAFITNNIDPSQRHYESSPLVGAIKQLLDLSYNINLPDALGAYLITPVDSLPRTALQEWQQAARRPNITGSDLLELLQDTAFDLVGSQLNVPSMDILQLDDVRAVRDTEEWGVYMQNLQTLLLYPAQFANGLASRVYKSYAALSERITERIDKQQGKGSLLTPWAPGFELNFNIAGATLSYRFTSQGPQWRLRGKVTDQVEGETVPIICKFAVRDMTEDHPQQDLSTGVDFQPFQMPDVQEQWKYIEAAVRKLPGFQDLPEEPEIVDPIISYKEE